MEPRLGGVVSEFGSLGASGSFSRVPLLALLFDDAGWELVIDPDPPIAFAMALPMRERSPGFSCGFAAGTFGLTFTAPPCGCCDVDAGGAASDPAGGGVSRGSLEPCSRSEVGRGPCRGRGE